MGPVSEIGVEEVSFWRQKFHLSKNLVIRIPSPFDTVSDFRAGEVPVYEGFFESGFRDQVPSLIAEVFESGEYLSEKKHHLIFERNWVSKLAFMPFPGFSSTWRTAGESRRVSQFSSTFMILMFFIFPSIDISRADVSSGRHVIEQLLGLPVDHCEISFLVSEEALDQCSIRGNHHICNFPVSFSLFVE